MVSVYISQASLTPPSKIPKQKQKQDLPKAPDLWIKSSLVSAMGPDLLALHTVNSSTMINHNDATTTSTKVDQILKEGQHLLDLFPVLPELHPHTPQDANMDLSEEDKGRSVLFTPCKPQDYDITFHLQAYLDCKPQTSIPPFMWMSFGEHFAVVLLWTHSHSQLSGTTVNFCGSKG